MCGCIPAPEVCSYCTSPINEFKARASPVGAWQDPVTDPQAPLVQITEGGCPFTAVVPNWHVPLQVMPELVVSDWVQLACHATLGEVGGGFVQSAVTSNSLKSHAAYEDHNMAGSSSMQSFLKKAALL